VFTNGIVKRSNLWVVAAFILMIVLFVHTI
jgi:hypothetical protein